MIKSMTGFGREHQIINGRDILVEVRSVNHRYFEFSSRLPRTYQYLEEKLKGLLSGKISRGKVEVTLSIYNIEGRETTVIVNPTVVENYLTALRQTGEQFGIRDDLALSNIFQMQDAFTVMRAEANEEEIWEAVKQVAERATERFVAMRQTEGEKLKKDILQHSETLEKLVAEVEKYAPEYNEQYRQKLYSRISELLGSENIDEGRILMEAAIVAEKTAIDEEIVRLKSHFSQLREMLNTEDAVGRKLDFLVQEMNRETNTIGSKCQDLRITKIVVDMKSEIEKIREQVQNIE
jgi:uncharacterized protein (TIGR00255 family)